MPRLSATAATGARKSTTYSAGELKLATPPLAPRRNAQPLLSVCTRMGAPRTAGAAGRVEPRLPETHRPLP